MRLLTRITAMLWGTVLLATALPAVAFAASPTPSSAATSDDSGFSLQVSPSPLVASIKPGQTSTLDLQIRNTSSRSQELKMGLRSFTIDDKTGQVNLTGSAPSEAKQFVSFSNPTFSLEAGQLTTEHIVVATPATASFSYSFATVISQVNAPSTKDGKTAIQGSVAVFTLLSVDRPGATKKLEINDLSVTKHVYEFLPATIDLKLKNTGNSLVQPKGTIYVQRHDNDATPLASINLNQGGGYILPGTSRTLSSDWNDGYPHYTLDANKQKHLSYQGSDISKLRFGRYVAKVIAVYDDNGRDVPLTAEVTFWVIPWRALLVVLFIVILLVVGLITTLRKSSKAIRRTRSASTRNKHEED